MRTLLQTSGLAASHAALADRLASAIHAAAPDPR